MDGHGLKATGVRRSLILLEADGAVENHFNVKKLFALLNLPSIGENFKMTADFKLIRILLGLSSGNPRHGCPYCLGRAIKSSNVFTKALARTVGGCKEDHQKFVKEAKGHPSKAKDHNNCINQPVDLMTKIEDVWTLAVFPPGPLHTVLLGITAIFS